MSIWPANKTPAQKLGKDLIRAVFSRNIDSAKACALVARGADLTAVDGSGMTALMWCSLYRHEDVIESLLEAGADPETLDKTGKSAMDYVLGGDTDDMSKLIRIQQKMERALQAKAQQRLDGWMEAHKLEIGMGSGKVHGARFRRPPCAGPR